MTNVTSWYWYNREKYDPTQRRSERAAAGHWLAGCGEERGWDKVAIKLLSTFPTLELLKLLNSKNKAM